MPKMKEMIEQVKEAFNPNDISGMKISGITSIKGIKENFHNYTKSPNQQENVDIIKPKANKLNQMYNDWGAGKISLSEIKQYKQEQSKIKNTANETTNTYCIWTNMLRKLYAYLDTIKAKMHGINNETNKTGTSQNKLTSFFSAFKGKLEQAKPTISGIVGKFKVLPKITQSITNHIKGMGKGIKQGLGHVLKYAGALFSLRGIYSILSNSAQSWLSSQNSGAQQLSANIEYLKYSMGSVFASVIQTVINLVYQLMKAIQSLVYAFSGVNIFAKATASSMKSTSNSAKQTNKSLSGIHSEINNVSESKDNASGGEISPNMDLSQVDGQMNSLSQKLYDFFKPLVDSWNTYGTGLIQQIKTTAGQIGELISSVWGSFESIITNGTVYSILENILSIIRNIAEAFENAWNYNNNGDAIVQNLADTFNNLLIAINNVVQSEGFQNWLRNCSDKFKEITEKIASIDWQPLINALTQIGTTVGTIALNILSGLVDIFKWLTENPIVAEILLAIALAITVVSTVLGILSSVMGILTPIATGLGVSMTSLILPILGIIAVMAIVIAIVILVVSNWEWLSQKATEIFNAIADTVSQWVENIVQFFQNLWQGICNIFSGIGQWFSDRFNNAVEGIKNAFSSVGNFFSGIWQGICNIFGNVANWFGNIFSEAWQTVQNVFNAGGKIFDGIKEGIASTFKNIVNSIIRGINSVVAIPFNAINTALRALRNLDLWGWQPFSWLGTINVPQIPTLAKGGVLTEATALIAGEYSGAKSNPEIVTPQNIMYDTMLRAISDSDMGNSDSDRPIYLNVYVGNKKIGEILIDDLKDKTRRTGKDIEALVGG